MCGSTEITDSDFSSTSSRSTPCAEGCCGPKFSLYVLFCVVICDVINVSRPSASGTSPVDICLTLRRLCKLTSELGKQLTGFATSRSTICATGSATCVRNQQFGVH